MTYTISKNTNSGLNMNMRHTTGGSVLLLNRKKVAPLARMEGGSIGANKIVGITQSAMPAPQNASIATVGGMMDFSKHVKMSARKMRKKGDDDSNINFVY